MAVALALYWLQPIGVMPLDDDFGYFRSILLTFQSGYPRADDWLEPWAASLSAIGALLLLVTGSFTAMVFGLKIAGGAASFIALYGLLRQRSYPVVAALALAATIVTVPTLLWRWSEFSTLLLYVPCLLGALLAGERRQWGVFFLLWTIAIASRQSAVLWLAIPLWHAVALRRSRAAAPIWIGLAYSAAVVIALFFLMNRTHSQTVITFAIFRNFEWSNFSDHALTGTAIAVVAVGLGAVAHTLASGAPLSWPRGKARIVRTGLAIVVGAFLLLTLRDLDLSTAGWARARSGTIYLHLLLALSLLGWLACDFALTLPYIATAAGFVLLLSVRVLLPEHHLVDLVTLAFFAAVPPTAREDVSHSSRRLPFGLLAGCAVVFAVHAYFAVIIKNTMDVFYARTVLAERAMRSGALAPTEIGFAPYGYMGWKLHPYFVANEGKNANVIAGHLNYIDLHAVAALHGIEAQAQGPARTIAEGTFPVGFLSAVPFRLVRRNEGIVWSERLRAMAASAPIYPLTDAEWRDLANADRLARRTRL